MSPRGIRADDGGIVTGWLLKIFLAFAIIGVVAYDAVSITMARVTASDDARSIAQATSDAIIVRSMTPERALEAGRSRAEEHNVVLGPKDLVIARDGTVTARIHRSANTLVAFRIPKLKEYVEVDEIHTIPGTPR